MVFGTDERAQSTLIGFILLFGILVIAFSSYQAVVVPNQNAEVEFNHNQDVQTDMQELRNSLLDARSVERVGPGEYEEVSGHRPVRVRLGTQYPARLLALNPPRPSGILSTVEPESDVEIRNANIENGDEFQEGANPNVVLDSHPTKFLSYQPNYNEYQNAPNTNFEHSLLYNEFNDPRLTVADQTVVSANSNQITLFLYEGDFSRSSSQALTLAPRTVDGPTDPVEIKPNGDVIRLALPTNALGRWEASLEDIDHASVNDESSDNEVIIDLDIDEIDADSYQLRMARVSFDGQGTDQSEVFTPIQLADRKQPTESSIFQRVEIRDDGDRLVFRFENTANEQITIEDFAVDATSIETGVTINDGNAEELEIRRTSVQDGEANRNGNPDAFSANGTRYNLEADSQANKGQYAIVGRDDNDVEVDFRTFSSDLESLEFVDSESEADLTVTFGLESKPDQKFYFRQE